MPHDKAALNFILLLGFISLFADMVYEGARSITGPYLGLLGASGAVVGFIAGFGELIGTMLRLVSGYFVDRTSRYWLISSLGYACLIAIPLLAVASSWKIAAALIIFERIGKALRTPARDTMVSFATQKIGSGMGFGLHQILDQTGSMLGPLVVTLILVSTQNYRLGFLVLIFPLIIAFVLIGRGTKLYPHPQHLELETIEVKPTKIPTSFWFYLMGAACIAAGYVDFPLIAFHFQKAGVLPMIWIPIFYMISMGASAIATLLFGWIYDHHGYVIIMITTVLSSLIAPLVFLGGFKLACLGMVLWGVGMGAQRSLFKAVIVDMVAKKIRGSAYGLFNTVYGLAWFLGSWLIGVLYDSSLPWLIAFSILAQLSALPFIYIVQKS